MNRTTKVLGITTAIVAVGALGAIAFAQGMGGHGMGHMGMGPGMGHGMKMGPGHGGMRQGQLDPTTRLASIKTELAITPAQEAAWATYAKVVEDTAKAQQDRRNAIDRNAVRNMTPQERQAFITKQQTEREAALAGVTKAAEQLLSGLDDAQKTKARGVLPGLVAGGPGMMAGGHGMRGRGHTW